MIWWLITIKSITILILGIYLIVNAFKYRGYLKSMTYNLNEYQWESNSYISIAPMSFKEFKDLYRVNKSKWTFEVPAESSSSRYRDYRTVKQLIYHPDKKMPYTNYKYNICIKFSFLNWIKFKWWNWIDNIKSDIEKKKKRKISDKQDESRAMESLLSDIQKDIDNLKARACDEIDEARDIMKEMTR